MLTCQIPRAKAIAPSTGPRRAGDRGGIAVMLHAEEMSHACDAVFLGEVEGYLNRVLDDLQGGHLERIYDSWTPCRRSSS